MSEPLAFTWDDGKSSKNLRERGFDFGYAVRLFLGPTVEMVDTRHDLEERVQAVGRIDGKPYRVTYTMTDETTLRIISAHRISERVWSRWQK